MSLKFSCSGQAPRDLSEHWTEVSHMQYPTKTHGSMVVRFSGSDSLDQITREQMLLQMLHDHLARCQACFGNALTLANQHGIKCDLETFDFRVPKVDQYIIIYYYYCYYYYYYYLSLLLLLLYICRVYLS